MNTKNMTIQIAHHPVSTRHDTGHGHIEVANTIEKDGREVDLDTKSNQFTGLYVWSERGIRTSALSGGIDVIAPALS